MITFTLDQLEEKTKHHPQGCYSEILASSESVGQALYEIDDVVYNDILAKWDLPSRWEMAKSLISAAAKAAQDGFNVRNGEETESILKICVPCPYFIKDGPRCGDCGCYLKPKIALRSSRCSKSKW